MQKYTIYIASLLSDQAFEKCCYLTLDVKEQSILVIQSSRN